LLGTGGLVRAYGKAAKEGVAAAGLIARKRIRLMELEMTYTLSGKVQYLLNEKGYTIRSTHYTDKVQFVVEVLVSGQEVFTSWIIDQTNAEIEINEGAYDLVDSPL
jgi:putative IMPACT (imprinted ancient) family translation regulator